MKTRLVALLSITSLLSGCMSYRSVIHSNEFGDFELPKDVSWEELTFKKEVFDPVTQQPVKSEVTIKNLKASMNPAVIDAETARMLALINAGVALGTKAAAAAGGIP